MKILITVLLFISITIIAKAQVDFVPVSHPVYDFLNLELVKGYLNHYSLANLPLQRNEVIEMLQLIKNNSQKLSNNEINTLEKYMVEFEIEPRKNAIVFSSSSDSDRVISSLFFSDREKLVYRYSDSTNRVELYPLASMDFYSVSSDTGNVHALLGNAGFRLQGTLSDCFGFGLQVTNGSLLSGNREAAFIDEKYAKNVKFSLLNSDVDVTESFVNYNNDWFRASISRQTRIIGTGISQHLVVNSTSPQFDAVSLGASFKSFSYEFLYGSLLGINDSLPFQSGFQYEIPPKYLVMHRFALKPSWGEFAFWESIVYSGRQIDLAYLNPLSFFKSLEHALHDRDNSIMGIEATVRPFDGVQLMGNFLLDDIIFGDIGTGYWSNKTAVNFGVLYSLPFSAIAGFEYSRVEPYTFTHFNYQNSYTNDGLLFSSNLLPNSDRFLFTFKWWFSGRYPLYLNIDYTRHGKNVYDQLGNLVKNVGADPFQTKRSEDSGIVSFLDGNPEYVFGIEAGYGIEVIRGFNAQFFYKYMTVNGAPVNQFKFVFRYLDFY